MSIQLSFKVTLASFTTWKVNAPSKVLSTPVSETTRNLVVALQHRPDSVTRGSKVPF